MNDVTFLGIQNLFKLQGIVFKTSNPLKSHFALQTNEIASSQKNTNITQPFNQWLYYTYEKSSNHSAIYVNQNLWYNKNITQSASNITNAKLNLMYSSLQTGALQTTSPFEGYYAGLAIYQQVATSVGLHSRLPGIKMAESLIYYFHFAQFQTEKIQQSPTITFQNMANNRIKLVDAIDLMLVPYDSYLSDDTNVNIQKCPPGQFFNQTLSKCDQCPQNCKFCTSKSTCTKCKSQFYQAATQHQGIYTCKICDYRCDQCFKGTNSDCNICRYQKLSNKCECLNFFNFSTNKNLCQVVIQSQELTIKAINEVNFCNKPLQSSQTYLQIEQQFLEASTYTDPENPCGCQNLGTCDLKTKQCTCAQGYKGDLCQYTDTVFQLFITKKNESLISLEKKLNQTSIAPEVAVQTASNLIKQPDTVNQSAFDKVFDIYQDLRKKNVKIQQLTILLSAATKSAIALSSQNANTVDKLTNQANSIVLTGIADLKQGASINITTQNIKISAIKANSINGIKVGSLTIESFTSKVPDGALSLIQYKENIFKSLNKTQEINLQLLTPNIYSGVSSFKQSNTNQNSFILRYNITHSPQMLKLAQQFYSGSANQTLIATRKQEYFVKNQQPKCFYWHTPSSSWRNDGCSYHDILQSELLCKCNHIQIFGAYFNTEKAVEPESEGVLFQAWKKSMSSLILTIGFYAISGFWVFYFVSKIFINKCDKKLRKKMSMTQIMDDLGVYKIKNDEDRDQSPNQLKGMSVSQILKQKQSSDFAIEENQSKIKPSSLIDQGFEGSVQNSLKNERKHRSQLKANLSQLFSKLRERDNSTLNKENKQLLKTVPLNVRQLDSIKPQQIQQQSVNEQNFVGIKAPSLKSRKKCLNGLKVKYQSQLERKSCCLCCIFFKKEFQTNSILYNIFARTSVFYLRSRKLTLILVTILTIFASIALSFDLMGAQNSGSILENVVENIWLQAISFVIAVTISFIIGACLRLSKKEMKQLRSYPQAYFAKKAAKNIRQKYNTGRNLGVALMYLLLIVYSLYFILYFAVTKSEGLQLWLQASLLVIFLEIVLIDILVAMLVQILVSIALYCKCSCALVVVYVVSSVRNIKNLAH